MDVFTSTSSLSRGPTCHSTGFVPPTASALGSSAHLASEQIGEGPGAGVRSGFRSGVPEVPERVSDRFRSGAGGGAGLQEPAAPYPLRLLRNPLRNPGTRSERLPERVPELAMCSFARNRPGTVNVLQTIKSCSLCCWGYLLGLLVSSQHDKVGGSGCWSEPSRAQESVRGNGAMLIFCR